MAALKLSWAEGACGVGGSGTVRRRTGFIDPVSGVAGALALGLLGGGAAEQLTVGGAAVGVGNGMVGGMGVDLEEEEAEQSQARGATGEQQQEVARVAGKQQRAEEREEEGAEAKGGQGESGGSPAMVRPVERRRLDGRRKSHAATKAGEIGVEAEQADRSGSLVVGLVQREVAEREEEGAAEDGRAGAAMVDEHADGEAHAVHAEVAKQADQVALRGGELEALSELGSPCRIDILR